MTEFLGPFHSDNYDSAKAPSGWVWPRPLGAQENPSRGRSGEARTPPNPRSTLPEKLGVPLPQDVHPVIAQRPALPHRGPCGPAKARTRCPAPRAPATPEALAPGERWGFPRRPRAEGEGKEGGFATIPLGGGSRGSGGGGGWRRRQRQRRRCPGTPLPIVPSPGQARPRAPHRAPRPGPSPAASPYLAAPGSPLLAKAIYPGKARAGPGTNPQTKSETSAGLERLLVGAFPPPSSPPSPPPPLGLPCGALRAGG